MAKQFKDYTLKEYLDQLSRREPVPGGGSAAALSSALGAGLISMAANYSLGKHGSKKIDARLQKILTESEQIRRRLLELVDSDARAYLNVVRSWKLDDKARKVASRQARQIPLQVCRLSYKAVSLTPILIQYGNCHLLSDVKVAIELLFAGFNSANVMVKINS